VDKADTRAVQWIAITCFAFGLAASRYDYYIQASPSDPLLYALIQWAKENTRFDNLLRLGLSAGTFTIVFKYLIKLYEKQWVWRYFHRKDYLGGKWVYLYKDESINKLIYGYFDVVHRITGISIRNARCWYGGTKVLTEQNQRGTWNSEDVAVGASDYWIAYQMDIPNPDPDNKEQGYNGVMKVKLLHDNRFNTRYWSGTICDHNATVQHNGRITAKRIDDDEAEQLTDWNILPGLISRYFDIDVINVKEAITAEQPQAKVLPLQLRDAG